MAKSISRSMRLKFRVLGFVVGLFLSTHELNLFHRWLRLGAEIWLEQLTTEVWRKLSKEEKAHLLEDMRRMADQKWKPYRKDQEK